jgi:hypothetical protein
MQRLRSLGLSLPSGLRISEMVSVFFRGKEEDDEAL